MVTTYHTYESYTYISIEGNYYEGYPKLFIIDGASLTKNF